MTPPLPPRGLQPAPPSVRWALEAHRYGTCLLPLGSVSAFTTLPSALGGEVQGGIEGTRVKQQTGARQGEEQPC